MKKKLITGCIIISFGLSVMFLKNVFAERTVKRFILATGANYGGPQRSSLRYAVKDANAFLSIMQTIGGAHHDDTLLLVDPSRNIFFRNISIFKNKIQKAKKQYKRVEAIFYYSGHADEEGILLGSEKIQYREIQSFIKTLPADVKIAILDSCSSGALAREKGGKIHSPFLLDTSYNMKGYAFMTSSSQNEVSQESDRIKGSFFTHYLISGLRGAADVSRDGRVTLNEAYQYAYNETLGSTQKTLSGPQHPNYLIKMSGTGDVVVTNIRKSSSIMIMDKDLQGRFFLRDNNNILVLELNKPSGRIIELGLEDGKYNIIQSRGGRIYETNISLAKKQRFVLSAPLFNEAAKELDIAGKGDKATIRKYRNLLFGFSLFPMISDDNASINVDLNLFGSTYAELHGVSLGLGPAIVKNDASSVQINAFGNLVYGNYNGVQASLINYVRGNANGAQFSYIGNYTKREMIGTQLSAVFNYTGSTMHGVQLAGVFNYVGDYFSGFQSASVLNYAKKMKGMQISVINVAGEMKGSQLGVVNIADTFDGFGFGGVNIYKKSDGVSLGLFNYADEQLGVPIGFINISRNGSADIILWGNTITGMSAGFRFQSRFIYTILSMGGLYFEDYSRFHVRKLSRSFYMGFHQPIGPLYIDIDAGYVNIDNNEFFRFKDNNADQNVMQGRITLGMTFFERVSIFIGSGISYAINYHEDFEKGTYSPIFLGGIKLRYWGNAQ